MTPSSKTIAITVTFNPDFATLKKQLESLKYQCRVIIVDNGSERDLLVPIKEYIASNDHIKLIALNDNIGISRAQNVGIEEVIKSYPEAEFVLLLDHDSLPGARMVEDLTSEFQTVADRGIPIAAIGPLLFDPRDKKYLGFHKICCFFYKKIIPQKNSQPLECHSLNSSGSLITLDALKNVGLLEQDFFMDHGETEWCFRATFKGYKIFGTSKVVMEHLMGDEVCEYWFFGRKRMPYRSPLRHYYIVRNSLFMQKRSYIPLTWKLWNFVKILSTYIYFGFFSKESASHRKFINRGISDGFKGVTGKIAEAS